MAKSRKPVQIAQNTTDTASTASTATLESTASTASTETVTLEIVGEKDMTKTTLPPAMLDDTEISSETLDAMVDQVLAKTPEEIEAEATAKAEAEAQRIAEMLSLLSNSIEIAPQPATPPVIAKKQEKTPAKTIEIIEDCDRPDMFSIMCILMFGEVVKPADVVKFVRKNITSKAFPAGSKNAGEDYTAVSLALTRVYRDLKLNVDVALISKYEDRVAVNGSGISGFIDVSSLLVDQWKYGKGTANPDVFGVDEVSLAVRLWLQYSSMVMGNRSKGVNIGDSTQYKHLSSTPRNVIEWWKHTGFIEAMRIEFYSKETPLNVILADFIEHRGQKVETDGKTHLTPQAMFMINQIKALNPRNYRYLPKFECLHDMLFLDQACMSTGMDLVFRDTEPHYNPYYPQDTAPETTK